MPHDVTDRNRTRTQVADLYFMEHRAKTLDVAAFLDRHDRAAGDEDFRVAQLRQAAAILTDGKPDRAKRILELMSDPTLEPIARAGSKGATGAYAPTTTERAKP
ncbi:MAG: hypothetical protein K8S99_17365 [Planctomycetes bacterium]|nr:hypothetical protein [Planctomycetota bacterium]